MTKRFRDLNAKEAAVVAQYAEAHGRTWKENLRHAWMDASEPGILQALRNELGPRWLNGYRLPDANSPALATGPDSEVR